MILRRTEATIVWFLWMLAPAVCACTCACSSDTASEQEVESMCVHLLELSSVETGGLAFVPIPAELEKCKADPLIDGTMKEMVKCRLAAEDVYSFWKCY
jgi:hypothetical protein